MSLIRCLFYSLKTTKYARRMQYNEKGEKHESENI